jgi:N-acetylmuramoyl-L-alanine amidase
MRMKRIYLSPSNQPANRYVGIPTNEKVEMEVLASKVKAILDEEYDCETVVATKELSIDAHGRPQEARGKGCDIYLALHSNAGGGGKASGAVAFHHPDHADGQELARNIVKELNAVCPIPSNRGTSVKNGMALYEGYGLAEIRNPFRLSMVPVLAEVDFHDNPRTAKWIVENKDVIAKAFVNALVRTYRIPAKAAREEKFRSYYFVQAGAFSQKENAEDLARRLRAAGFEGYVKLEKVDLLTGKGFLA